MILKKTAQGKSHSNANKDAHPGARSYYCHAFDSISVRTEPRSFDFLMLHVYLENMEEYGARMDIS